MKNSLTLLKLALMSLLMFFAATSLQAQGYPCDSFCVESIKIDSADNTMLDVVLYNSSSMFIDYPTLRVLSHGDTVGNKRGTVEYFGQLGKTTLTYTMATTLKTVPSNFKCTVLLTSPLSSKGDTCFLPYPCSTSTSIKEALNPAFSFSVYPDPASSTLFIAHAEAVSGPVRISVYDMAGKQLACEYRAVSNKLFFVDIRQLPGGMYLLSVTGNNSVFTGKFIRN